MSFRRILLAGAALQVVHALPQVVTITSLIATTTTLPATTVATSAVSSAVSSVTSVTASVAIPSASVPADALLPSQAPLPPKQAWCPSEVFCAGPLLQTVDIAHLFPDSKTFVDKPTLYSSNVTLANFASATANGPNTTIGSVLNFVQTNFKGEGLELRAIALNSTSTPSFLSDASIIPNPLARAWTGVINSYWDKLIRDTNEATLCSRSASGTAPCESSLIPLNHTFVVPGGRFREQYYWDSFWIIEGLLKSELYDIVKSTLENFMDELEQFGFIPNGGRIYYLNRSQPPVFIHMLYRYVNVTRDYSILQRALPLADAEMKWWANNRTVEVVSPFTNQTWSVAHYAVTNSAPRPESYLEDYESANGADLVTPYTEQQKADLYAELASGAESGWDYSSRWSKEPLSNLADLTNLEPLLRSLNVRGTAAVDLNSILYKAMVLLADLYELYDENGSTESVTSITTNSGTRSSTRLHRRAPSTSTSTTRTSSVTASASSASATTTSTSSKAVEYRGKASLLKEAILDLMWDSPKLSFYDFNITANSRSGFYSAAAFYPMWNDIWPAEVLSDEEKMKGLFASVGLVLGRYNGTYPATFLTTGMQWDAPNTWPPHQYIVLEALSKVPSNVSTQAYPQLSSNVTSFSLVPPYQLGLGEEQLPVQVNAATGASLGGGDVSYLNGTWTDAGVATTGETWNKALLRGLANRYFTSSFCSWYSTGGSIPGILAQLSPAELNATHSTPASTGHMFEKFNLLDIDAAGSGGEYTVQDGFGWTNGVVLWLAAEYGTLLAQPTCPAIQVAATATKRGVYYKGKRSQRSDGAYVL